MKKRIILALVVLIAIGIAYGRAPVTEPMRYVALVSQTGTNNPVVTVLENSLSGSIVWTRNGEGDFTGTLTNGFIAGRTTANISVTSNEQHPAILCTSNSHISLMAAGDDYLDRNTVEIVVYPAP